MLMLKKKHLFLAVIFFAVVGIIIFAISKPSLMAENIDRGKTLYNSYCIHCHGISGGGDGPAAGEINPKPRNFQDPAEMNSLTTEIMERAIVEGIRGTAMQGWSTILNPEEVKDIIEYIESFKK